MYSELKNVEIPLVKTLEQLDWQYIKSAELDSLRASFDNPFILSHLKDAILKLKQGFGRLIRGYYDMGICIINDPRLTKRRYGRYVIDSLPVEPIYYSSSSLITYEIEKVDINS